MSLSWGHIKAVPNGLQHIKLKRTGEHFIISRPNTHVKNLIFGQVYIEQVGESIVTNLTTGEVCVVEFKEAGFSGKNKHYLEGLTYDSLAQSKAKKKVPSWMMSGTWSGSMHCQPMNPDGKKVDDTVEPVLLWEASPWPE